MLQIILIALYAFIVGQIQKPFANRIKRSKSVEEALRVRKHYKIVRYISISLFLIINLIASFVVQGLQNRAINIASILVSAIGSTATGYVLAGGIYSHKEFNPISFLTVNDFKRIKGNFSLFLRGFNVDNYSSKQEVGTIQGYKFSEYTLAKLLSKGSPLFAVGMTKELTSPEGAKRIYLSDDNWKEDVLNLMSKASSIYILINGKDSCVWEIEQSMNMLEKTCFIVDDLAQYEIVKMKIGDKYQLPNLLSIDVTSPFAFRLWAEPLSARIVDTDYSDTVSAQLYCFANTEKGYKLFIHDLYGVKTKKTHK